MGRGSESRISELSRKSLTRDIRRLYERPISSTRSGALFNAFSYPTKISPEVIAVFIATHTSPGASVLDTFGGSGTTGLATLLCDRPTEAMKHIAVDYRLKPHWGPRKAVIYEIGTLGAFIAETMCHPVNARAFEEEANQLIARASKHLSDLYAVVDPKREIGEIRHIIWSDVLACPRCRREVSYYDSVVPKSVLKLRDHFFCPHCKAKSPLDFTRRVTEKYYDPLIGRIITRKKRVPAVVYGKTKGRNWKRAATADDLLRVSKIGRLQVPHCAPIKEIEWGDLYRSGYHTGISHLHHFYTYRNFLAISSLWNEIQNSPAHLRNALRLMVLSYNATHSTLMTRVVIKNGQKDFVLTGAQTGVLYISALPVEKNVFLGVSRKIKTLTQAFSIVQGSGSSVEVRRSSSTQLTLPDSSIDYVFTDPPFGDFIPYAEINQINEIWLGKTTDRKKEIIVSQAQGKSVERYGILMKNVLNEIARVLKQSGRVTLVFHSSKAEIWQALTEAYALAGFGVRATSILDKIQESFKQVVSTVSVKGDPLLLLEKRRSAIKRSDEDRKRETIINSVLEKVWEDEEDVRESLPERMYSRFITQCLEAGVPVSLDAEAFYEMLIVKRRV